MLKIIAEYGDIISTYKISRFEHYGHILRFRAEIALNDDTVLYIREAVLGMSIRKYSYHWQDRNGKLIMRWDNAPDWEVATFPHHVHVGREDLVEQTFDRTLAQVLSFIRSRLLKIENPPAER